MEKYTKVFFVNLSFALLFIFAACSGSRVQEEDLALVQEEEFVPYDMVSEGDLVGEAYEPQEYVYESEEGTFVPSAEFEKPHVISSPEYVVPSTPTPLLAQEAVEYTEAYSTVAYSEPSYVAPYRSSRAVKVRTSPFQSNGFLMNAFYFVREQNESYSTLSKKLYGRTDKASLIAEWNSRRQLEPGTVVYYNSAARPEDSVKMLPFAQDYSVAMESYVVRKGDTLSQLAQEKYGDKMLWKELSGLNPQLQSPDLIQPGQRLLMQPRVVNTKTVIAQLKAEAQKIAEAQQRNIEKAEAAAAAQEAEARKKAELAQQQAGASDSSSKEVEIEAMLEDEQGQAFDQVREVDPIAEYKASQQKALQQKEMAKNSVPPAAKTSLDNNEGNNDRNSAGVKSNAAPIDARKQQSKMMLLIGAFLLLISALLFWKRSRAKAG